MSETRKNFEAYYEIRDYFISGIKKTTEIISLIKEEADTRNRLAELEREESKILEQIKGLKISLKLVEKEKIKLKNKEETKKALEEIISLKGKEIEKVYEEIDRLKSQLSEYTAERGEYENYIYFLHDLNDDHSFTDNKDINFEEFSRNEFIAYLFVITNIGSTFFPGYVKKNMPEILHEVIDATEDAIENGWDSFIKWIEEN